MSRVGAGRTRRATPGRGPAGSAVLAVALSVLLAGCTAAPVRPGADPADPVDAAVAHDLALLHAFAVGERARPGVRCVQAALVQGGLPRLRAGAVDVFVVTDPLPATDRDALVRAISEAVWDLGLTVVSSLSLSAGPPGSDATGSSDVGRVLGGPDAGQTASDEDLRAAFGPPAPAAGTVPPDPGPRDC